MWKWRPTNNRRNPGGIGALVKAAFVAMIFNPLNRAVAFATIQSVVVAADGEGLRDWVKGSEAVPFRLKVDTEASPHPLRIRVPAIWVHGATDAVALEAIRRNEM